MSIITQILSVIQLLRNRAVLYGLIGLLFLLLLFIWKQKRDADALVRRASESAEQHIEKAENELTVHMEETAMKLHLKNNKIKALLDSLKIKPKHVVEYKYIRTERVIHDTLWRYELMEIEDYQQVFTIDKPCFSASVDLTGENPVFDADVETEIYDINYVERRHLLGWKRMPKWGRKEWRQTLITCGGDTIRENYKITTK